MRMFLCGCTCRVCAAESNAAHSKKQYKEALQAIDQCIAAIVAVQPRSLQLQLLRSYSWLYWNKASIYSAVGDGYTALRYMERTVTLSYHNSSYQQELGFMYIHAQQYEHAYVSLLTALRLHLNLTFDSSERFSLQQVEETLFTQLWGPVNSTSRKLLELHPYLPSASILQQYNSSSVNMMVRCLHGMLTALARLNYPQLMFRVARLISLLAPHATSTIHSSTAQLAASIADFKSAVQYDNYHIFLQYTKNIVDPEELKRESETIWNYIDQQSMLLFSAVTHAQRVITVPSFRCSHVQVC